MLPSACRFVLVNGAAWPWWDWGPGAASQSHQFPSALTGKCYLFPFGVDFPVLAMHLFICRSRPAYCGFLGMPSWKCHWEQDSERRQNRRNDTYWWEASCSQATIAQAVKRIRFKAKSPQMSRPVRVWRMRWAERCSMRSAGEAPNTATGRYFLPRLLIPDFGQTPSQKRERRGIKLTNTISPCH